MKKRLWTALGLLLTGIGFVNLFIPGMPTTVFLIMALFCFKKGSSKFDAWLLNHKVFGPTLRDWERTKGIRPRTKKVAVGTMWIFLAASIALLHKKPIVGAIIFTCGVWVTWYILSRPDVLDEPVADVQEPVRSCA